VPATGSSMTASFTNILDNTAGRRVQMQIGFTRHFEYPGAELRMSARRLAAASGGSQSDSHGHYHFEQPAQSIDPTVGI